MMGQAHWIEGEGYRKFPKVLIFGNQFINAKNLYAIFMST